MKRLFLDLIVIFTIVCVVGLVPSFAGDRQDIGFGEERHGVDTDAPAREARRGAKGANGLSSIKEAYTSLPPAAGESYNTRAESVFYAGETIYLVDRYYVPSGGNYTRYYFIKDVVGYTVAWSGKTFSLSSSGAYWGTKTISADFLGVGSYVYQSVTLGPGAPLVSDPFPFVVD